MVQRAGSISLSLCPERADRRAASEPVAADPERWLAQVAERCLALSPGVGLGSDVAVAGDGFAGSGLWLGESMAHLAVFGGI